MTDVVGTTQQSMGRRGSKMPLKKSQDKHSNGAKAKKKGATAGKANKTNKGNAAQPTSKQSQATSNDGVDVQVARVESLSARLRKQREAKRGKVVAVVQFDDGLTHALPPSKLAGKAGGKGAPARRAPGTTAARGLKDGLDFGNIELDPSQMQHMLTSTKKEIDRLRIDNLYGKKKRKHEQRYAESLGAHTQKSIPMPIYKLQGMRKKAKERERLHREQQRQRGNKVPKKRDSQKKKKDGSSSKYTRWWVDSSKGQGL